MHPNKKYKKLPLIHQLPFFHYFVDLQIELKRIVQMCVLHSGVIKTWTAPAHM